MKPISRRHDAARSRGPNIYYMLGGAVFLTVCWSMGSLSGLGSSIKSSGGGLLRGDGGSLNEPLLEMGRVRNPLVVEPSREQLPMGESFYTSNQSMDDTSTTIIFNVFRGDPEALNMQLEAALQQKHVVPPAVWVMIFSSPKRRAYEAVVDVVRAKHPDQATQVALTASDFNYKFHGRFLLAYMATTKYVLIVDDDKPIDATTVRDYIQYMNRQKGVWGNNGHLRAPTFEGYKSWPSVGYNLDESDMAEQDYLCGMWFLEQTWLEYFMKERPPSWVTAEDMHLSHVMRKYLNLNTYGGKVALNTPALPGKDYAATTGSALDLREFIFDHQLGRGNKVANVDQPLETLVYAEAVGDIEDFLQKLDMCPPLDENATEFVRDNEVDDSRSLAPWCRAGKTAAVFRGAKEQDVVGLIAAAKKLCERTDCEYFSAKPNIKHGIRYFNMREGYGQTDSGVEVPFQTGASDMMLSLVGILNNVLPSTLFLPDVSEMNWPETDPAKRNRLQIYHRSALLAVDIHRNSQANDKWSHRNEQQDEEGAGTEGFPTGMETLIWQPGFSEHVVAYAS